MLLRAKQPEESRTQEFKGQLHLEAKVQRVDERGLGAPDGLAKAHALGAPELGAVRIFAVVEVDEVVELAESILDLAGAEEARQTHLLRAVLFEGLPGVKLVEKCTGRGDDASWQTHLLADLC
jgi:hypothetical protein